MPTNVQFTIAVHIMTVLGFRAGEETKSDRIAASINTSASFVRRTLAKLSKARLVRTTKGSAGFCELAKKPAHISMLDIYRAVNAPKAFAVHGYKAEKSCAVSCNIKGALEGVLSRTQTAMDQSLSKVSLADLMSDVQKQK